MPAPLREFYKGKRVLITLGSTREYLDPVRFLTNASSGKMGQALAHVFRSYGAKVFLICGPAIAPPKKFPFVAVGSAREMFAQVKKRFPLSDIFVSAAAVSDFRAENRSLRKIKREKEMFLKLVPNPDILENVTRKKGGRFCVGFALEESASGARAIQRAKEKMAKKRCDLLILNSPSSMESGWIRATILSPEGLILSLGKVSKEMCAKKICGAIAESLR